VDVSNSEHTHNTEHAEGSSEAVLRPLAPVLLSKEEMAKYDIEFSYVFAEDRIRNIALSGPYGAGKNTVIESWEAHHQERDVIHVELAHFGEQATNESYSVTNGSGKNAEATRRPGKSAEEIKKRDLEAEILNQLIHKIDSEKTPKSRFKRTANRGEASETAIALAIMSFIILSLILTHILNKYSYDAFLALPPLSISAYLTMFSAWVIIAVYGIKQLIRTSMLSKTLKRLKFVSAEIEVTDKGDDSAFNRLMDDLLYLINESGYDAIVFEDLDRFNDIYIFEKLRTINSLANRNRPKGKTLKFIYLIHDGLFTDSHDRVKFFDYIIPVIPYVDTSNSFDVLKNGLLGIGIDVDNQFLRGLSFFIDDPRILNAIIDETFHYSHSLGNGVRPKNPEDAKRLVGIIAYKETFPSDFENLQISRGYLYTLLNKRSKLQEAEFDRIDERIKTYKQEIYTIERQIEYDEDELALLFLNRRIADLSVYLNLNRFVAPQDLITAIKDNGSANQFFEQQKRSLETNDDYQKRLTLSKGRRLREIKQRQNQISKLNTERMKLNRNQLRDLFVQYEDFVLLDKEELERPKDLDDLNFNKIIESPYFGLIPYLIRSGAVDESYERYISNFYPLSLTNRDRDFVTTALQGVGEIDPERSIDSLETVIEHLDESCLSRSQGRNFTILQNLLERNLRNKLGAFLKGLEADEDYAFLIAYTASNHYSTELFPYLHETNSPIVRDTLHANDSLSSEEFRIFCHMLAADGGALLSDSEIAESLKVIAIDNPRFLAQSPANPKAVAQGLERVNFSLNTIDFAEADDALIEEAYLRHLFEPNSANVAGFLLHYGALSDEITPRKLANTVYMSNEITHNEILKQFVEDNASTFVASLLAEQGLSVFADEGTVAWILNSESLDENEALPFVEALEGKPVKELSTVKHKAMKAALLSADKAIASGENALDYYEAANRKFDEVLEAFVERNKPLTGLNIKLANDSLGDDNTFFEDLIKSDLAVETIGVIASDYGQAFASFSIPDLPNDIVEELIKANVIPVSANNLEFIRLHYTELAPFLASTDIKTYYSLVIGGAEQEPQVSFLEDEVLEIFEEPNVDADYKIGLLVGFESSVALNEAYPEELLIAICDTKFSNADLQHLPAFYERGSLSLKRAIAKVASSRSRDLMAAGITCPFNMFEHILKEMAIRGDADKTTEFLAWRLRNNVSSAPTRQALRRLFDAASLNWYVELLDGSKVTVRIPSTKNNSDILSLLKEWNMCSSIINGPTGDNFLEAHPKGYTRKKSDSQE